MAEMQVKHFDAAKSDYQALERMKPGPSPAVYYGLAMVAQGNHDQAAEIRYDKLYLGVAPRNTLEFTNVTQQLRRLQGR
jgi:hypothetical protein